MAIRKSVKKTKTKKVVKPELPHYWICWYCAQKLGGKYPDGDCSTVMQDTCNYCGKIDTVIPVVDFIWPGQKYKIWD